MGKKIFVLIIITNVFFYQSGLCQDGKSRWVDSVFQTLNTSEKIGQLFMIPAAADASAEELEDLISKISRYQPGGILITRGGPNQIANLINLLQRNSHVPLLAGVQAEWGIGQTVDSVITFQKPLVLGAVHERDWLVRLGAEVAREMKALGLHINFAPNADIHLENIPYPQSLQYFSDRKERVAEKAIAFMKGLQQNGVMACAIHPATQLLQRGYAQDTTSHLPVPLDTTGLYPYKKMVEAGLKAILTAHLHTAPPDQTEPATQLFTQEILKKSIGFNGLAFADITYLEKIIGEHKEGDVEKIALELGSDVLINPDHLAATMRRISRALKANRQLTNRLNEAVKKILAAKYDAGLHQYKRINTDNLLDRLNAPEAKLLRHQLSEQAVTLIKNDTQIIPVRNLENKNWISVSIGKEEFNEFTRYLSKYARFEHYAMRLPGDSVLIKQKAASANVMVVGIFPLAANMMKAVSAMLASLAGKKEIVVVHFGDPAHISLLQKLPTLLAGYSDEWGIPKMAAQIIFGGLPAQGELPLWTTAFEAGHRNTTETIGRFSYSLPEAVGIDSRTLSKIENIAREAIVTGATPGSHVLVAKDGKVIYEQSNGYLTYQNKIPVTEQTIYDLASVTKVTATLQAIMFLYDRGMIDINKKASVYLPELKNSNKKDCTIKDILTHQAGLWPFLPFWNSTVKNGTQLPQYYSSARSEDYPFPVADGMFAHKSMKDSLWQWIIKARMVEKPPRTTYDYRYSDMGFYILQHLAEKILNQPMEDFLDQNLYEPLGAYTLGYLPLQKFPASQIAPTENDQLFRKRLLVGYVHDQGAAMHGGIAGHAGLFGTANDLAKVGQMLLQKGKYGGYQYYRPETVELFTARQFDNSRRGLGWDKPMPGNWTSPTTPFASNKTFGHTGFTGTCIWVDPEFNLVYVYLSNRVHPDMNNNKLLNANIRPRIQEVIYKAIFDYRQYGSPSPVLNDLTSSIRN
jgi:beta-N-acetylhexosaminidase